MVARDLAASSTTRRILGEPVVALSHQHRARSPALEDACPHRLAPALDGPTQGRCHRVRLSRNDFRLPGASACAFRDSRMIPRNARVRSYPVVEKHGACLDLDGRSRPRADRTKVYDLPQYHDPQWSAVEGDALQYRLPLSQPRRQPVRPGACELRAPLDARKRRRRGRAGSLPRQQGADKLITWRWIIDSARHPAIPEIRQVQRQCRSLALLPLHARRARR